jgi:hypothetical protein
MAFKVVRVMARRIVAEDLDWLVERLARRRGALAPHAPVYWRPAADATRVHRRYLAYVLSEGGGVGFRVGESLLIAVPGRDDRWIIDDAVVPDDEWGSTGQLLWEAFGSEIEGGLVRFVCPVPEPGRAGFARAQGLQRHTSWWHQTVEPTRPPAEGREPRVEGATASLVPAPPVYDPGGPVLFLTAIQEFARVLPAARAEARRLGCPLVVADQPHRDTGLASALRQAGYRRHCDFFHGELQ